MIDALRTILQGALERLQGYVTAYLPAALAALTLVVAAWLIASTARWLLYRIVKGMAIDRFLRRSGLAFLLDGSGRLRGAKIVAETVYWGILGTGLLMGIDAFNTDLTTRTIRSCVFLLPKLAIAGAILIGGVWLSHYFGRSVLVWSVNEDLPSPRRLAAFVRVAIVFVAVVVAAYQLDFARPVFLSAFILVVAGAVLSASLTAAFAIRGQLRRFPGERPEEDAQPEERSLWSHL